MQIADIDGTTSLLEVYETYLAPPSKKDKKSKKSKGEKVKDEEDAPKRKKRGQDEDEEADTKKKSKKAKKQEGEQEEAEEEMKSEGKKSSNLKAVERPDEDDEEVEKSSPKKGGKKDKSGNVPFQRIKSDEVQYLKVKGGNAEAERLLDNTFESKFADGNVREDYGAKASAILVAVRGKDFRHEKTKKKRGTYKGGPIDLASNSIKFVNSSDEDEE